MELHLHPDISVRRLSIGSEGAPLLVIDNVVDNPDALVDYAVNTAFNPVGDFHPGTRAAAPLAYQQLLVSRLQAAFLECLRVENGSLQLSLCHYSLMTTPALTPAAPQRLPHVESLSGKGLATVHYLFKSNLGGTAFYRHRKTGFEFVDEARNAEYSRCLRSEGLPPEALGPGYISGDTALFDEIAKYDGVFNRMLVYRRNSLHAGSVGADFEPDANPGTGRLSINSFIDLV